MIEMVDSNSLQKLAEPKPKRDRTIRFNLESDENIIDRDEE